MIRRKLTRIEVTLDDTKELDDFFTRTPHINQQLMVLGKKFDLNQTTDSPLDPTSFPNSNNAANSTINTVVGESQANQSNLNESETRFMYNPQPFNPSLDRFSQDN